MKTKTISIIGCGWLGLPVAKSLLKKGYRVNGSTTSEAKLKLLENEGIQPFLIDLRSQETLPSMSKFLQSEVLFINIPPGRSTSNLEVYLDQMSLLIKSAEMTEVRKVVLISSTSVYASKNLKVTEDTSLNPESGSGKVLKATEELFSANPNFQTTILRMAGLVGPGRHPGRFLSRRKNLDNPDGRVNLIHLEDCIAIVNRVLEEDIWSEMFNCCSDIHPTRRDFYTTAAAKLNISISEFCENDQPHFKLVSNAKLKSYLAYTFKYSDPAQMI